MKRDRNWLQVATIATVIYGAVLGSVLGGERIWCFVTTGNLNEVGDFFAGTFAPLALIWLVAAVLTQRQELEDARKQFASSQDVIDRQLTGVQQQNDNATEQAIRNYKLSLYEHRFDIFREVDAIARNMHEDSGHQTPCKFADNLAILSHRSLFVFGDEVHNKLIYIAGLYQRVCDIDVKTSDALYPSYDTGESTLDENIMAKDVYLSFVEERSKLMEEIETELSFASRTLLFRKYLDVTDVGKE